jgi:hypothetical protein
VQPIVKPSVSEPGWQVYQSTEASIGIALPPAWKVVTLTSDLDAALRAATTDSELQAQLRPVLVQLRDGGVRFFAFDPTTPVGNLQPRQFPALAYVTRRAPPPSSLDAFFAALPPEPAGRVLLDSKHASGAVGDIVIRRVRETRIRPDRSLELSVQYQCGVLRSGSLYLLTMQVPDAALDGYASQLEKIALSFAPF